MSRKYRYGREEDHERAITFPTRGGGGEGEEDWRRGTHTRTVDERTRYGNNGY